MKTKEKIIEEIIEIIGPLINYYYKGGEFEDEDLYNEDIADKLLPLFSLQKQEIVKEIENKQWVSISGLKISEDDEKTIMKIHNLQLEQLKQTLTK